MAYADVTPELGIKFILNPTTSEARWIGTRLQLEEEGIIPPTVTWLNRRKPERWDIGPHTIYFLYALGVAAGQQPTADALWMLRSLYHDGKQRDRIAKMKLREIAAMYEPITPEWHARWKRLNAARTDRRFQQIKRDLLGQKRRGRKPQSKAANA